MNAADTRLAGTPAEQRLIANRVGAATTDAATGTESGLLARFLWSGDRYMHRIEIGGTPVMQTVLRDPTVDWPEDPPLQQLSIEQLGDQQAVAFGVGSAGTSHWSLSIEAIPGAAPALRYDLACHSRRPPSQLGSTFEMLASEGQFVFDREETAVIEGVAGGVVRILSEPSIGPTRWKESEAGRVLSIAADLGRSPAPGTFRWGFRVLWQPPE